MSNVDKIRKWLRRIFPGLYKKYGRYFHTHYRLGRRILRHARRHPKLYADPDIETALRALRKECVSVFSFPGCGRYDTLAVEVHRDEDDFPWVDHGGRRLYFRRGADTAQVVRNYRRLRMEQDPASPHCYCTDGFGIREGDVLLDIGAAEGILALDNIEKVSRAVLFEIEDEWAGALEKTFAPWRSKVTIIKRFASDVNDGTNVTVDRVVREGWPWDRLSGSLLGRLFLKLDVEGCEERVLRGAAEALSRPDTRAVVCTYHRHGDYERLSGSMRAQGFEVAASAGWMLFVHDRELRPPFFRRGVIYCER